MTDTLWTDDRIEELKEHWKTKLSCSEIGALMNISRNAVIGKIHRLGLSGRVDPREQERRRQERNAKQREKQADRRSQIRATTMQELPPSPDPFIGSLNIPFNELRRYSDKGPNQCRYIAAEPASPDYLVCGNETLDGESWCGHCKGIVYGRPISDEERARRFAQGKRGHRAAQIKQYVGRDEAA
jgi:GcrA cell cycle regulator